MGKRKIDQRLINGIKLYKTAIGADKIVLFGSYARGDYTEDSDVDLILVSKKFEGKKFHARFKGLWLKWNLKMPVDFIPLTPEEFKKQKKGVSIISEALKEGIAV